MKGRMAVIDFGTNTARLLIADLGDGEDFRHVFLERRIVRMGGGFTKSEGLSADAVGRGLSCLTLFARLIRRHRADRVLAVATSAVRDAANGAAFVAQVQRETGIRLRVIDGETEGTLTLAGVLAGLDRRHEEILMFDVGGGSTEYTLARSGQAVLVRSLPMGVVRLTEGKGSVAAMERKIGKELDWLLGEVERSGCSLGGATQLIGTAGTATTLAAIRMEMEEYDYRRVNNSTITKGEIAAIYERLLPLTPRERLQVPGLERGREDLIIAGILITLQTMERFGMENMKVSDYGLLEGLVVRGEILGNWDGC